MEQKTYRGLSITKTHGFDHQNHSYRSVKQQNIQSAVRQVYLNGRSMMADQFHEDDGSMATLMQILVFCNENGDRSDEKPDQEKSLLDFAAAKGFYKKLFDKIVPKIAEVKMDGAPRTASAIIELNGRYRLLTKERPERVLGRCDKFLFKGKTIPLTMNMVARVKNVYQRMISDNLQVVMLAVKDLEKLPVKLEPVFQADSLTLVGMIGLHDSL
jgi:magnesium-transporting ATPase (P-type)